MQHEKTYLHLITVIVKALEEENYQFPVTFCRYGIHTLRMSCKVVTTRNDKVGLIRYDGKLCTSPMFNRESSLHRLVIEARKLAAIGSILVPSTARFACSKPSRVCYRSFTRPRLSQSDHTSYSFFAGSALNMLKSGDGLETHLGKEGPALCCSSWLPTMSEPDFVLHRLLKRKPRNNLFSNTTVNGTSMKHAEIKILIEKRSFIGCTA